MVLEWDVWYWQPVAREYWNRAVSKEYWNRAVSKEYWNHAVSKVSLLHRVLPPTRQGDPRGAGLSVLDTNVNSKQHFTQ